MAHFIIPPNTDAGDYSIDNNGAPGAVWRVVVPIGSAGVFIALAFADGLVVRSNNPGVIETDAKGTPPETPQGGLRLFKLVGSKEETTILFAQPSDWKPGWPAWASVQVQVVAGALPSAPDKARIILAQPSMALNAHDTPVKYAMKFTALIAPTETAADIMGRVKAAATAAGGTLKHLAISCHGYAGIDDAHPSRLDIGTGLNKDSVELFSDLAGKIGVIWIGACVAAGPADADAMCKLRAINAKCYLVAPAMTVSIPPGSRGGTLPLGQMDLVSRFMPNVFTPGGGKLPWRHFLTMGKRLDFQVKGGT